MNATGVILRLLAGALLLLLLAHAVVAPEVPRVTAGAALLVAAATLWRPLVGLLITVPLSAAGALLAPAPVRGAEVFAVAFLAAWLLPVWRPLRGSAWPRRLVVPAAAYGAAIVGSWLKLTLGESAGVAVPALAPFLLRSIPADYLVFSSPHPETWTLLQNLCGLGLLLAAAGIASGNAHRTRVIAWVVIGTGVLFGLGTMAEVGRQWAAVGFEPWFLLRYADGERFALQIADPNAAGSWLVIPVAAAAGIAFGTARRRVVLVAALVAMAPAVALTGSRAAYVGLLVGLGAAWLLRRPGAMKHRDIAIGGAALAAVAVVALLALDWDAGSQGSAGSSLRLRAEFLATTARMFEAAPVFGVGIGRYFDRSAEFMSDGLRALYGNENAHNYVAQQFAEMGIIGGILFLWLAAAVLRGGTASFRESGATPAHLGLLAGVVAYLTTCLTGHPLLVPEAALTFWIVAGVVGGGDAAAVRRVPRPMAMAAAAAILMLVVAAGQAAVDAARSTEPPRESGFHQPETDDGLTFRWMARHGVTYIPNGDGFLRMKVRAPQQTGERPLVFETSVAGRVIDRRVIPSDRWVDFDLPARRSAPTPFQRVDFRANQWWTQEVTLGQRPARRPIAVRVAEVRWIPLSGAMR